MKHFLTLLIASLLLALLAVHAEDTKASVASYTLNGQISDDAGKPLAGVRVGLKILGVATQTDPDGRFTLVAKTSQPFIKDKANAFDYLELDKDGYMGKAINI